MSEALKIIALCVLVCVVYGVLHDQVTARVCIEYFTVGHVPVLPPALETPTLLGVAWGVIATWWVGVLLGTPLAVACRAGGLPKRGARSLVRPLLWVVGCSAVAALVAGVAAWALAKHYQLTLPSPLGDRITAEKHAAFIGDLFAHNASYLVGFIGGVVLIVTTHRWRWRQSLAGAEGRQEPPR